LHNSNLFKGEKKKIMLGKKTALKTDFAVRQLAVPIGEVGLQFEWLLHGEWYKRQIWSRQG